MFINKSCDSWIAGSLFTKQNIKLNSSQTGKVISFNNVMNVLVQREKSCYRYSSPAFHSQQYRNFEFIPVCGIRRDCGGRTTIASFCSIIIIVFVVILKLFPKIYVNYY
jgi:hypothetical protein